MVDADLAVLQWELEERQLVMVCQLVKMMCQSVGRSSQIEDFQRSLRVLIRWVGCLCL